MAKKGQRDLASAGLPKSFDSLTEPPHRLRCGEIRAGVIQAVSGRVGFHLLDARVAGRVVANALVRPNSAFSACAWVAKKGFVKHFPDG